jgi:CO/xanthine dehydrogenase FAD-binding subunit
MTGHSMATDVSACEVFAPFTVAESVQLLTEVGEPLTVLAGGTDLMPAALTRESKLNRYVLDLHRVEGLRQIYCDGEELVLGATVTVAQLRRDALVEDEAPLLREAARHWAPPEIASRATIGGNLMTAGPAGDLCTALLALRGMAVLASNEGRRRVPLFSLLVGAGKTSAEASELLVEVRLPRHAGRGSGRFRKVSGRGGAGQAKVNLASFSIPDPEPGEPRVVIALGGIAGAPTRLRETERIVSDGPLDRVRIARAVRGMDGEITPADDLVSSARYRRTIAARLLAAALTDLL